MNSTTRTTGSRDRRRALSTALAVLASSAALTAVTTAPAQAAEGAPKPRVVFTESKNVDGVGMRTIVSAHPSGTDRREIVPVGVGLTRADIGDVALSPDGTRMAFINNEGGFGDVWIAYADGREARSVFMDVDLPDGKLDALDWASDGRALYLGFANESGSETRIMRLKLDGPGLAPAFPAPDGARDSQADVAWDGRVTFVRDGVIHIWDPRVGGDPKPVTRGQYPAFSPTGDRIAFAASGDSGNAVKVRALDGGSEQSLAEGNATFLDWSPEGSQLAYSGGSLGEARVISATVPGSTPAILSPGTRAHQVSWANPIGWNPHGTFRHDYTGDGKADLLAMNGAGDILTYKGTGTGAFEAGVRRDWGWKGYRLTAVGDLNGDALPYRGGWPDALAQDTAGDLWRLDGYTFGFESKVRIGTGGWKDLKLTGVGDLTGDGYPDVLAIDPSGNLWQYAGDGRGGLEARQKAGYGYNGYRLTSVGAFTASGYQNYLGVAPNGDLYRYERGTRHKIGWGWSSYTLTGVGDLTGDGISDVLARDSAGVLWRYDGDGTGGLKTRVKIGWGWNGLSTF
ncbi:hypothetical protein AB0A76_02155 [Streptomyces exfoliatus]|uniref:VCBS repeat-containing protein n=1 Tax=Streptomyces exfoliatus TaxID=1905 RepID=A0ABV3CP75_STREX